MNYTKMVFILLFLKLNLSIGSWHPLDIYFDLTEVIAFDAKTSKSIQNKDLVIKYFIPYIYNYFKASFKVRENNIINKDNVSSACKEVIKDFKSEGLKKDFYWYVKLFDDKNSPFAGLAFNCDNKKETNRPYIGAMLINIFYLAPTIDISIEVYKSVILHETMHALGFINTSFAKFIDKNLNLIPKNEVAITDNNKNVLIINKTVLDHAKVFFNCPTMNGIKFENNGAVQSRGHHFEFTELGYEVMNSAANINSRISEFTFKFFESTGWYQLDYNYSQKLIWGNYKGCNFLKKEFYSQFSEFCYDKQLQNCSEDYLMKTKCEKTDQIDNKFINKYGTYCTMKPLDGTKWSYVNHDSRCLINKQSQDNFISNCYKSYCTNNGRKVIFELNSTLKVECTQEGDLNFNNTVFSCPNIQKFCDLRYECKNSCSGNGTCFNGNCICFNSYSGIACEHNSTNIIDNSCNNNCNNNGTCINANCQCYDNYKGNNCETIINDVGSFGSRCSSSLYVKCYNKITDKILLLNFDILLKLSTYLLIINILI